jgi:hypothetical protein
LKRASSLFTKVDSNFDFDNILDDEVTQTNKPEFLKHVIDKALQGKAFKKIELEIDG